MSKTSDYHDSPHSIITTDQTLREQIEEIVKTAMGNGAFWSDEENRDPDKFNDAGFLKDLETDTNQILKLIEERIPKEKPEEKWMLGMDEGWNNAIAEMKKEIK